MHSEDDPNSNLENQEEQHLEQPSILRVSGMYEQYFLDYASYVILERAVPALKDGLKPVQRRLLHALKEMDDGRYHKVANVIGQTMKYHPHGDASIGDALVQLGQKDLLIDTQGNWGNILTGDSAAAPRYIEARLTKFALEVAFSPKVTEWQSSYDSRGKEPVQLPMKFPLVLALGAEGIAVGLSTKILPHNFIELIDGSIKVLRGQKAVVYPDFLTGGIADFTNYNDGIRGGKVRVRAKISQRDTKTLVISEIPFATNTQSLIDSILRANDKGKIKVKKIEDNTAENVEILIYLPPGISPDKTIDALYAFTDCEISVSPNICVIHNDKPVFAGVSELLKESAFLTKEILEKELQIKLQELQEQWHFASLERIFIEHKIYRDIEEAETWEEVISFIRTGLEPHVKTLIRAVTDDDIVRLTEIKIKRISKFDSTKANDHILSLEEQIELVKANLANIVNYTIDYYKNLKKKYGAGRERKTEIRTFDDINAKRVAIANQKLYVNRVEGFIGTSLKRDEFVCDCSDIDDIIVILRSGKMKVVTVDSKIFIGKDIIHVAVFKKKDQRTVYNLIYRDGKQGNCYMKRFNVTSITREKEYDLTQGKPGSTILYFTANPNGEAETVTVNLKALQKLKKLKWDIDFADLAIKGRSSKGNLVSKFPVRKIELKEKGVSTLAARKIWFDSTVNRLNVEGRGDFLGAFKGEDKILTIMASGHYRLVEFNLSSHFEDDMIYIKKWNPEVPISAVYWEGEKQRYYVKRFLLEDSDKKETFISESSGSQLELATVLKQPKIEVVFKKVKGKERENLEVDLAEFIAIKGMKALGNQLTNFPVKDINLLESDELDEIEEEETIDDTSIEEKKMTMKARLQWNFSILFICLSTVLFSQDKLNIEKVGQLSYNVGLNDVWGYTDATGIEYALVGLESGVSIVDISTPAAPVEKINIVGPNTIWRDLKTWDHYAFVTHDIISAGNVLKEQGLLIIDLDSLENPFYKELRLEIDLDTIVDTLKSAHNLYIDENGICYVFGSNVANGGALILDVATDPWNPEYLGIFDTYYLHDGMARGDTLWGAAVYNGIFAAIDVSEKDKPSIINTGYTSKLFTHNCWISDDGNTLYTTDERTDAYIGAYDVSDIGNSVRLLDKIQRLPGTEAVPHNVHVYKDWLVTSYYSTGVQIVNAKRPELLIEVGYYDTYPLDNGANFNGNWGAYPYYSSGLIAASDRENGLFILQPDYKDVAYADFQVSDSVTGELLFNTELYFSSEKSDTLLTNLRAEASKVVTYSGFDTVHVRVEGYQPRNIAFEYEIGVSKAVPIRLLKDSAYADFQVSDSLSGELLNQTELYFSKERDTLFTNSLGEASKVVNYTSFDTVRAELEGYQPRQIAFKYEKGFSTSVKIRLLRNGFSSPIFGDFIVYPNPVVNGEFEIAWPDAFVGKNATLEIYSNLGQKISSQEFMVSPENIYSAPKVSGVYYVKVVGISESFSIKKILVL